MRSRSASTGLALAVAATGFAGMAATAPSAQAATIYPYMHNSANYSSLKQCNDTRGGVVRTILAKGGKVTKVGRCNKIVTSVKWTSRGVTAKTAYNYTYVSYKAKNAAIKGDYRSARYIKNPYSGWGNLLFR